MRLLAPVEAWTEPLASWMPLRQAVFKFGMTEDEETAAIYDTPFLDLSNFKEIASSPALLHEAIIEMRRAQKDLSRVAN